jgi:uncharacterized OB-fold protein
MSDTASIPEALLRPPVPVADPDTEPFWTSLAEGTFRCCRCTQCRTWLQPPLERCRHCAGEVGWEEVSGDGTVFSYIVVRHQTIPGHTPPYVVALVELVEQPGLRFTGLLDADPTAVEVGQSVRAVIAPIDGTDVAALRFEVLS